MKIFIDVGAHFGESARVAMSPRYGFDRIFCIEPSSECWEKITRIKDPRVVLVPLGLSNESSQRRLFDPGTVGASVFSERHRTTREEIASFVDASEWIRENTEETDEVFAKINVEGSECDIIENLLTNGLLNRIESVLVNFDVRKFPYQRHREMELHKKLRSAGATNILDAATIEEQTRTGLMHQWLQSHGATANRHLRFSETARVFLEDVRWFYFPRMVRRLGISRLARRILPKRLFLFLYRIAAGQPARPKREVNTKGREAAQGTRPRLRMTTIRGRRRRGPR